MQARHGAAGGRRRPVDGRGCINLVEDDPEEHTVGYGGLPNEEGVVELDACVMHGPTYKAGAVAALQNIRHASSVARAVMQHSDHVLLAGAGALQFAKAHGFKEEDLLTDEARASGWWKLEKLSARTTAGSRKILTSTTARLPAWL